MENLRVLHLITELGAGGAQTVLLRLLTRLDRVRFSPVVACLYSGNGVTARRIRALGIPVVDLGMAAKWRWDAFLRLYCLLRQQRPMILHAWMFHANLAGRIVGRLAGVPAIVTSRRNVQIGGRGRELLKRATSRMDDRVIAVCESARQAEIQRTGAPSDKVVTIYNGIDVGQFSVGQDAALRARDALGISPDVLLIGTIGRLHPQKGISDLFHAMAELVKNIPDVRLLVVGEGALQGCLENQCRDMGLSETVIFAGLRTDIPEILSALDLLVLPSLWEGLPNVVLEAMAAGLAVVATAVGGTPEVVVDGQTGLLVPPGDGDALARAIACLLDDPALRRQMGQAGRQRAQERFSVERMVEDTERLYAQLLAEQGLLPTALHEGHGGEAA